jgi:hypothetical protein
MSKQVETQKYVVFDGDGDVIAAGTIKEVSNAIVDYENEEGGLAGFSIAEIGTPREFELVPASIKLI